MANDEEEVEFSSFLFTMVGFGYPDQPLYFDHDKENYYLNKSSPVSL